MPRAIRLIVPVLLLALVVAMPPGALAVAVTPTTTTVTVDHASVPAGTGVVAFTVIVTPDSGPGPVTGSGNWTLSGTGGPIASNGFTGGGPLNITVNGLAADTYTLTAVFAGDAAFGPSSGSASASFVIIATTTTVTVDHATVPAGTGLVQFTVNVAPNSGPGPVTGTGTWTLSGSGGPIASNTFSAATGATVSVSGLAADTYTLSATYAGNATFGPSSGSASASFVIIPTTTTVTVDKTVVPAGIGLVSFMVAVTPNSGSGPVTGSGTWTLSGPGGPIASNTFTAGSPFSINVSGMSAGTYTLTAVYDGNANFGGSTGSASTMFVIVPTTTTVTVDHPIVPAGTGLVSFTASVVPASNGPTTGTGTWTFTGPGGPIASNTFGAGGPISINVSGMPAGTYTLTATYPGNATFGPSSGSANVIFTEGTDSVALSSSQNPSFSGQLVTFTAVVTGSGTTPAGSVTFLDGAAVLGTASLDGTGTATFSTSALGLGGHSITAAYAGSSTYSPATSAVLTQVVNAPQPPTTTAALTPPANGAGWNNTPVTVTLTSTPASGGMPVAATYYAVDDPTCAPGALATCSTYAAPFGIGAAGIHTVTFFSVDTLGDFESVKSVTIRIDLTAPATTATLGSVPNGAGWFNAPVTVSFGAVDALSGVDRTEFSLDGGAWTPVAGSTTVSAGGLHTLAYRSVDKAGNVESTHTLTLKIDVAAPTLTVRPTPGARLSFLPLLTLHGTATFRSTSGDKLGRTAVTCFDTQSIKLQLTATDAGSGPTSFTYSATGAQPIPNKTVSGTTATITITERGVTTVLALAMDGAGNASPSQRWALLVRRDDIPIACAMPLGSLTIPSHGRVAVDGRLEFGHGWTQHIEFTLKY